MNFKYKEILISILIGAITAFLTTLFDSVITLLQNHGNDIVGGITASATYTFKNWVKNI